MSINYSPRTWVTGEVVTAAEMNNEIQTPFTGIQAPWTNWSPVLTASTTNPTGWTSSGRYQQYGKTVFALGQISAGASATAGSGAYGISLPVNAVVNWNYEHIGVLQYFISASAGVTAVVQLNGSSNNSTVATYNAATTGANSTVGSGTPAAPVASSSQIQFFLMYEAA